MKNKIIVTITKQQSEDVFDFKIELEGVNFRAIRVLEDALSEFVKKQDLQFAKTDFSKPEYNLSNEQAKVLHEEMTFPIRNIRDLLRSEANKILPILQEHFNQQDS